MSGPSSANDTPITDYRQLVEVMASGEKPRGDWRMPRDARAAVWLDELAAVAEQIGVG